MLSITKLPELRPPAVLLLKQTVLHNNEKPHTQLTLRYSMFISHC